MAISIDWGTRVISIPQSDLTFLGGTQYELDTSAFRLQLKDLEDSDAGMTEPDTHRNNSPVTLGGVTYARIIEIINGYTITFEETGSPYSVSLVGSNNNILDVTNLGTVQILSNNSAGLVQVTSGSGLSTEQAQQMLEMWRDMGLDPNNPVTISENGDRNSTDIDVDATTTGTSPNRQTTLTRQ